MSLTDEQVDEIWHRWSRRPTIRSLAKEYGVSESIVRAIISIPYPPSRKEENN